jgi:tetratricopeptide (TPR) repeat protein
LSNIYQGAKHVVSPEFAVGFLLNYIETRNAHGRFTKPGPLSRYGDDVARVLKQHPELEGRVLELAKRNLRQSLIHNTYTANRFCFNPHNDAYMRQHFDEFARVADDVIDTYGSCPAVVNSVATYLFQGLNDYRHSIRVLMDAHARQTINTSGLGLLCQFVEQAKLRKANVADLNIVEILKSMVEANPHKLSYRRHLALAFKRHKQPQQLEKLLDETYAFFSAAESENEFEHSQGLVELLSEFGRHDEAVEYLIREIAYWKEQVDRDESYEGQYGCLTRLAVSYLFHGKTKAAIDARLESMKFWNEDHGDDLVQDLADTLFEVDDLASIEKWLIEKLESSGSEQPIVRKALGRALQDRDDLKSAAGHFEVALKYQPADSELRRELIEVYDQLERPDDKRRHVLLLIEWSLTNDRDSLVDLLFSLGDQGLDLRMATNLVEVLPDDAEAHLQLAELWDADETRELAILVVQKATELEPNDEDAFFHLVELQIEAAQWQAATWSLERIRKTKWAGEETDRIKQWSKTLSTKQKASKAKPKSDNPFE